MPMNNESLTEKFPTTSSNTLIDLLILLKRNNQMKLCSLNHFNLTFKGNVTYTDEEADSKEMAQI